MEPGQGNKLIIPSRPYTMLEENKADIEVIETEEIKDDSNLHLESIRAKYVGKNAMSSDCSYENYIESSQSWDEYNEFGDDEYNKGYNTNTKCLEPNFINSDFYNAGPMMLENPNNEGWKTMDKIKIPERDYIKPDTNILRINNMIKPAPAIKMPLQPSLQNISNSDDYFSDIKLSLDIMRQKIEANLDKIIRNSIQEALSQLKEIDIMESKIYAKIVQGPAPKVKEYKLKSKAYNLIINDINKESESVVSKKEEIDFTRGFETREGGLFEKNQINEKSKEKSEIITEKPLIINPTTKSIAESITSSNFEIESVNKSLTSQKSENKSQSSHDVSKNPTQNTPLLVSIGPSTITYSKNLKTTEQLNIKKLTNDMNCLVIDNDNIMFVGGVSKVAFNYCISKNNFLNFPKLIYPQRFFGFNFIGDSPAVIGGLIEGGICKKVEIFKNFAWKEIESLNSPRSHSSAIKHNSLTYLIGGTSSGIKTDVEMYENGWKILEVKISSILQFGVVSYGNCIYIMGGRESKGKKLKTSVIKFDTSNNTISNVKKLKKPFSSLNAGSVVVMNKIIYLLNESDKSISDYIAIP
ncbi:hypothetical protein SteCoe_18563 [Stentor coeruleus]|uniref:Uncharacterized protein n=1 Tax=Stentor coeruleus TaxID=5963 RepID=A0A1R2BWE6_9CILI|nr:hypothetical protein SteCoe_18563 [Stentor coeruleus]